MENNKNILILGDGLLGSELIKQTNWDYMSRKKNGFDAINFKSIKMTKYLQEEEYDKQYTHIINCIGHTDTRDNTKDLHWKINYKFVSNLSNFCTMFNIKLVHISTDYVYAGSVPFAKEEDALCPPANWYGYSKLLGDGVIQLFSGKYLLIRTTFKPNPYPYDYAWHDLVGNFDYVDVISKMIIELIENGAEGVFNVGTEVKTLFELAKRTNPNVKVDVSKWTVDRPTDTTMCLNKYENFKINKINKLYFE